MPRSTRSRQRDRDRDAGTSATAVLDDPTPDTNDPQEDNPVTASDTLDVTDQEGIETQFEFSIERAPEDFEPERKSPGRVRAPSYFDTVLRAPDVFEKGWQRVPVSSDEHREFAVREINRAKLYLNGSGRQENEPEIGIDFDEKQEGYLYFKSRVAQKRERKAKNGGDNGAETLDENAREEGTYDPDGDNDA